MKKLLLSAAITLTALSAFADLVGDGYYRVQNALTKRYAYLLDDKGFKDPGKGTVDVKALKLFMDTEKMKSDPSTVFYIDCQSGDLSRIVTCDIMGQGTSLYKFFDTYMQVMRGKMVDGEQSYYAYGSVGTASKYIGDRERDLTEDEGYPDADTTGDWRLWYIKSVDKNSDDCFFGISPALSAGGRYYHPFYAGFPFNAHSDGMKVYSVSKIDAYNCVAVIKEISGTVPSATPVIVECSSPLVSGNRLDIGGSGTDVSGNRLGGVYFNNDFPSNHINRISYNKRTMRLLTVKDGKLSFDQADITYLPRIEAYLQLNNESEYAVPSYQVMTEAEYEEKYAAVESISVDALVDVYSLDGRLVKAGVAKDEVRFFGKGLYILRSGAASERLIVR